MASSPSTAAGDELPGKYAMKRGDCQCVTPGSTTRSRSASSVGQGLAARRWRRRQLRPHPAGLHVGLHADAVDATRGSARTTRPARARRGTRPELVRRLIGGRCRCRGRVRAEEVAEHRRRGAPHGVADQLEEEDRRARVAVPVPALLAEDLVEQQLDTGTKRTASTSVGLARDPSGARAAGDERHDERAAGDRHQVVELAEHLDDGGVEADLLAGLAQRRLDERLAGVCAAAREADLALVRPQALAAPASAAPRARRRAPRTPRGPPRAGTSSWPSTAEARTDPAGERAPQCVDVDATPSRREVRPRRRSPGPAARAAAG